MYEWHKKEKPIQGLIGAGGGATGYLVGGSGGLTGNYFGDGSDGALNTTGNVTYTVPNKNGSYDGDYVVKQYTSLTVNSGHTITTDQPCKGLMLLVNGDCVIDGAVSMRYRGAANNPDNTTNADGLQLPVLTADGTATLAAADFAGCGSDITTILSNQGAISGNGHIIRLPKRGASGGLGHVGGTSTNGAGSAGANGQSTLANSIYTVTLGGGGGGGKYSDTNTCGGSDAGRGGNGGGATCFSGGTGGGGKMSGTNPSDSVADDGDNNGGQGGKGGNGHCGGVHTVTGGCGNPGGTDQYGSTGQSYGSRTSPGAKNGGTGGVVWFIVRGNLTINGEVDVRGTDQDSTGRTSGGVYGGGGGSGGGAMIFLHGGTFGGNPTLRNQGGAGFTNTNAASGSAGGSGSVISKQILV